MAEEKLNAFRLGRNDEQFSSLLTGFEDGFWDACFSKLSQRAIAGFTVCTYMQHDLWQRTHKSSRMHPPPAPSQGTKVCRAVTRENRGRRSPYLHPD